ncbi:MAG: NADH-quinone oxidoreductase subunit I [Holophagaceae bacterium]|nr:NADH-quinone oxidoreductase subunit I [Holophagaceae bacterium]
MGIVVKKVDLTWLDRTYLWPVAKGLSITLKHFLKQAITPTKRRRTVQYPDMKRAVSAGYRGLHELKRHNNNSVKCVACFMCAEACPSRCITIKAEEIGDLNTQQGLLEKRPASFQIDLLRCIFCGMCQEACPKDAIWLRNNYELTCKGRTEMRLEKFDLMNTYAAVDGKSRIDRELGAQPSNPWQK